MRTLAVGATLLLLSTGCVQPDRTAPAGAPHLPPVVPPQSLRPPGAPLAGSVEVYEKTISIPTYAIADNPYPVFPTTYWSNDLYPYSLLDSPSLESADRQYRALILENEFLRLTVLPEVGGHLYSFYDKVNNREAVYVNHVIKPLIHGLRWGWPAGGFEFNFPHAHFYSACDTIDCSIRRNPDGSGSIFIGDVDQRYGMQWQVTLTLQPGKAYLLQEVAIHNRTALPHRYHFWTINAFRTNEHTQVVFPARRMLDHSQKYVYTYPIWGGHDVSWTRNLFSGGSWSALEPYDDFWCTYHHDEEAGMVHVADCRILPGSKWFAYGPGDRSNYYAAAMSDQDGPYIEVDSGSDITQIGFRRLTPLGSHRWEEYWYPVKGLKGQIVKANREAALSLVREDNGLAVVLNTTSTLAGGRLTVSTDAGAMVDETISVCPLRPYERQIGKRAGVVTIVLKDDAGKELLAYTDGPVDETTLPPEGPTVRDNRQVISDEQYVTIHPEDWWIRRGKSTGQMSAEELYLAGLRQLTETRERFREAEELFKAALEKDPGYSLAHTELGILKLGRALWNEAQLEFAASIERNPQQGVAFYYRGLLRKIRGDAAAAIEDLFEAVKYADTCGPAYRLLAEIALQKGELDRARDYLQASYQSSPSAETLALLAAAHRKSGDYERAEPLLDKALFETPLNYLALYERYLLACATRPEQSERRYDDFVKVISDRDQCHLQLACTYMNAGLQREAVDVLHKLLARRKEAGREPTPMALYYLGYLYRSLGRNEDSAHHFRMARSLANWELVFPARLGELAVLEAATEADPEDFLAKYALGNLLAGRYRFDDAVNQWQASLEQLTALPEAERARRAHLLTVLYRNIGIILWKVGRQPDAAIPYLQKSLDHATGHFQPYEDLASLYAEMGQVPSAIGIAQMGLERARHSYMLVNRLCGLYTKRGEYDEIIRLLSKYPADDYTRSGYQVLYQQAHMQKGRKLFSEQKFDEALVEFDAARRYPDILLVQNKGCEDFAEALWWKGLTYTELGKENEARTCWKEGAGGEYDAYSRGNLYKAKCLMQLGEAAVAEELMHDILFACATSTRVITEGEAGAWFAYLNYLQAAVHEELGDLNKARELYTKAIEADPAHEEPVYSESVSRLKEMGGKEEP